MAELQISTLLTSPRRICMIGPRFPECLGTTSACKLLDNPPETLPVTSLNGGITSFGSR